MKPDARRPVTVAEFRAAFAPLIKQALDAIPGVVAIELTRQLDGPSDAQVEFDSYARWSGPPESSEPSYSAVSSDYAIRRRDLALCIDIIAEELRERIPMSIRGSVARRRLRRPASQPPVAVPTIFRESAIARFSHVKAVCNEGLDAIRTRIVTLLDVEFPRAVEQRGIAPEHLALSVTPEVRVIAAREWADHERRQKEIQDEHARRRAHIEDVRLGPKGPTALKRAGSIELAAALAKVADRAKARGPRVLS